MKITPAYENSSLRVAVIANWNQSCGISTYCAYLLKALKPLVDNIKIFAEEGDQPIAGDEPYEVDYCWKRGCSPTEMISRLHAWKPTFVLIQHEYGIFPKAGIWLKLIASLEGIPYAVVLHSVYEHQDKAICTSVLKNVICHSEAGRDCLLRMGHNGRVTTIPHGCIDLGEPDELWNCYQVEHPLIQFGFGFEYKGVDTALEALALLKARDDRKYDEVFFTYLCSESPHTVAINNNYYESLLEKVSKLRLTENVAIHRGYLSEENLHRFLRVNKLAIFPYRSDPQNVVYGASGAIRLALANRIPTIASTSPMFADLDGVVPRASSPSELALIIDRMFSDGNYRDGWRAKASQYTQTNTWQEVATKYIVEMQCILDGRQRRRFSV